MARIFQRVLFRESFFLIRCSGHGDVWFNCFGAMFEIDVVDEYIIDTGHIVAFTEGLDYKISKIGGYKSLFFSGEGFVARFKVPRKDLGPDQSRL